MRHEALTEAISMIDDKYVAEAQEPFQKSRISPSAIKICAAVAACAAAGAILLLPKRSDTEILVFGEDPSANPVAVRYDNGENTAARTVSVDSADIPVSIASADKTVVSISEGELFITENGIITHRESPLELEGNAELLWSVSLADISAEYNLTAQTGQENKILTLSFDESRQEWTINY